MNEHDRENVALPVYSALSVYTVLPRGVPQQNVAFVRVFFFAIDS